MRTDTVTVKIKTADQMHDFGVQLGRVLRAGDLLLLTGELGAGKTTLTRGIGEGLNVRGPVTSPTFVLARTHPSLNGGPQLVHIDAYRLGDSSELEDLDIDFKNAVVVAEWGAGLVDEEAVALEIVIHRPVGAATEASAAADDMELVEPRLLEITGVGERWQSVDFAAIAAEEN